jgi:hypothetical protein
MWINSDVDWIPSTALGNDPAWRTHSIKRGNAYHRVDACEVIQDSESEGKTIKPSNQKIALSR